jgi:hypothetical protein
VVDENDDAGARERAVRYDLQFPSREAFRKIDLLFVVDNSISMADKQRIFADAVPVLLRRLISPLCIDAEGNPTGEFSPCPSGAAEFRAIDDIHVGVITSSLGNHGGEVCVPNPADVVPRTLNDRAELLPGVRGGLYSYDDSGFLVWDPRTPRPFPDPHPGVSSHETSADEFIGDFASHVRTAGERGCGYEASLEAWYRFLVDPEPVAEVTNDGSGVVRGPVNAVVLEQRARFLRHDSLLAVVVLTDENDCSIVDENGGAGWLVGRRLPMPRASSECKSDPGSEAFRCCRPCEAVVEGCPPSAGDAECQKGPLSLLEDSTNLRCFQQKQRFGIDLLYPTQRYVDALTRRTVVLPAPPPDGAREVANPIFAPGEDGTPSPEGRAFLVGILGVPWQDIAAPASLDGRGLEYLGADELSRTVPNRWDVILGDPDSGAPPLDPFMIESVDERTGRNPITLDPIEPSHAGRSNSINGHEQSVLNRDDLQYACTFELFPNIPCTATNQDGCDCNASELPYNRPLCQYPGADVDGVQTHAKAYPGLRQLEVLKGLGQNAVVASVCPKNSTPVGEEPAADPDYGYNPAVGAMLQRFKPYFVPRCLPRPLPVGPAGHTPCSVVEGRATGGACLCDASKGRFDLDGEFSRAVRVELESRGFCADGVMACDDLCLCDVHQFSDDELFTCQNSQTDPGDLFGFCYVDPETGNPDLVAACPEGQPHDVRFLGLRAPEPPWFQFIACPRR